MVAAAAAAENYPRRRVSDLAHAGRKKIAVSAGSGGGLPTKFELDDDIPCPAARRRSRVAEEEVFIRRAAKLAARRCCLARRLANVEKAT